ncbi:prolyl oligopeptidase family serine peptidase [Labilibaculum antarcticum]|uniref:prolyl oligopeptidase n=1 Tax=Labilibaculum antarcticum TaxID=1717717 RepID=A0A1Y1CFP8_9BACT|nr:prolyl oligopeptidase family serine peptidase [Labilibaculum antarcticum]BAX79110.1 S9 family peptidase [Labilibaculum antarcticum]
MKYLIILLLLTVTTTASIAQKYEYPICPKQTVVDTFFNAYTISENYRWLENVRCDSVVEWIKAENKLSDKFTGKASAKYMTKQLIKKYSYMKTIRAQKKGPYYFSYYVRNKFASAGLYMGTKMDDINQLLVDPNFNTKNKKTDIKDFSLSKDSKFLCYLINRDGTDWMEAKVICLPSGIQKKDHLTGIKHSSISWRGHGFFYSKYPYNGEFSMTSSEEVYYHKLGDEQSQDQLIFKRKNPNIQFSFSTTSNEKFFILKEETESCYNYFFIDYSSKSPYLRPLLMKQKSGFSVIDSHNNKIIAKTFKNNNGGSVVEIDPYHPYNWREIAPACFDGVLLNCKIKENGILCMYQSNQHPVLKMFNFEGKALRQLELPDASSITNVNSAIDNDEIFFYNQQYTTPPLQYHLNTTTFKIKPGETTIINYNFKDIEYKPLKYKINDSLSIPITLVYKKGLKLDGNNPTLLKAYGGFGAISSPSFDSGVVYFINQGGVYAFANIRGGGDLGEKWAREGRRLNKQNSIDDFNAAAEFLIHEKYTNPNKLGITGSSHGGLIVAAAAIQRPDLYAAVVPIVAVTDMLRFEHFTVGNFHIDEFGTVKDSLDFINLKSYSPLHNIKEDINYPAMLVMTSENDDRVPPFHSYKFVAELQNRSAQTNPILLRVEKDAGHSGAITNVSFTDSKSDLYGFIMRILMN